MPVVLAAGAATIAAVGHHHYPIQLWLFWRYASYWLVCAIWSLACLSFGLVATRLIVKRELPQGERLVIGFAVGVYVFALAMFVGGLAGSLSPGFAVFLPAVFLILGRSELSGIVRCARTLRTRPAPSALFLLASAWGLVCLAMIYLTIMTPENASYDARWYHLPIAEHYAAQGAIRRFPEGWFPGAVPQLASLLYAWAFCLPQTALFDRVELAAHLEFILFLATLAGVPVLVRRLVPQRSQRRSLGRPVPFSERVRLRLEPHDRGRSRARVLGHSHLPGVAPRARSARRSAVSALGDPVRGRCSDQIPSSSLLLFPMLAILVRAIRLRRWAGPLALCLGGLTLTSPHWLKNWIWYGDPLYPVLHDYLSPHPWTADSKALVETFLASGLWRPTASTLPGRLVESLGAMFTFSFSPHDWEPFHHGAPVFGSLFTIAVLTLPFLKGGKRVAPLAICTLTGVFAWYWVSHQDRYLQALVPWMAATTAAAMALIWRTGGAARLALAGLVALQIVWGGDAYFTPAHPIIGSPVKVAVDLLSSGFRHDYVTRLRPFGSWWDIGVALPKDSKLLVHEMFEHVGTRSASVSDAVGWQGGINYGRLSGPRDVFELLSSMGVTHIAYRPGISEGRDSIAGDLIFFEFAGRSTRNQKMFGHIAVVQMPARAPQVPQRSDIVVFMGCEDTYASGRYHLGDLVVPAKAPPSTIYPTPMVRMVPGEVPRLDDAGFAVIDLRCRQAPGADELREFSMLGGRDTTQLWARFGAAGRNRFWCTNDD